MKTSGRPVKITIINTNTEGEKESISTRGIYMAQGGIINVRYKETGDGGEITETSMLIKPQENRASITRTGFLNNRLVFNPGKAEELYYETPFGSLVMELNTDSVRYRELGDGFECRVIYTLIMGGHHSNAERKDVRLKVQFADAAQ